MSKVAPFKALTYNPKLIPDLSQVLPDSDRASPTPPYSGYY